MFFCVAIVALISGQLLAEETDLTPSTPGVNSTNTLPAVKEKEAKDFYNKLNSTLMKKNPLHPKRIECIVTKLQQGEAFEKSGKSSLINFLLADSDDDFSSLELEELINRASFSCTVIGYCAIALIVLVMVIVVSCVSFLSKKK